MPPKISKAKKNTNNKKKKNKKKSTTIAQQKKESRASKKKDNKKITPEAFLLKVSQFEVDISHVSRAFTIFVAADFSFLEPTGS